MRRELKFEKLCAMTTASEIGNGWQSPRISFTLDLDISHTDSERTGMAYSDSGNGWQSPRISFSFNLSPTDRFLPEKRRREDVAVANYDTDFEFCVASRSCNGWNSTSEETLLAVADELFVDGKILPLIPSCIKSQPVTIARHLSLEISRSQSPLPSTSHPPPNIPRISSGNVAAKSLSHKSPSKWKEIMLKLSNKENAFAESRGTTLNVIHQTRSVHNGKEQAFSQGSLCCPSPFFRGRFRSAGCKHTAVNFTSCHKRLSVRPRCTSTERETLPGIVEGSKPLEASSICNNVQLDPRYLGELTTRLQIKDGKTETKAKHTCGRSKASSGGAMDSDRTTRRVLGNLESSTTRAAKAASPDSPQPGRPIVEGSLQLNANKGGIRVSSAWNVGGSWNGVAELLGFFFKRHNKQPHAFDHYNHAST